MNQSESPQIKALKERYRLSFPGKIELLNQHLAAISSDNIPANTLLEIHEVLHKLAGSSGMYNYDDISDLCRETMSKMDEPDNKGLLASGLSRVIELLEQHC